MKSSTVSKIISKIQFTLYSLFAFILSNIIISYALLTNGVSLPLVILPHFKAEQLYIKLDKKLTLHAERISVSSGNKKSNEVPLLNIPRLLPIIDFARNNFHSFKIDELNIDKHQVTFSYTDRPKGPEDNTITLTSDDISARVDFSFYDDFMLVEMKGLIHKLTSIPLSMDAVLDFRTNNSYTIGKLSSSEKTTVDFHMKGNGDRMVFTAHSNVFSDLDPVVDLFALEKNISKWIVDYNNAQSYQLLEAKGIYDYRDPQVILDTLFLHARETDLDYSFHPKLFPVSTAMSDVYYSKGVLRIKPHQARYNTHVLDEPSAVDIDFNDEHTTLNVDLYTQTPLDKDIVEIVNAYDIPLPLLQEKGETKAHLQLSIDLFTEDVLANGQFFVKESDLILDGVRYKIKNATARLHKGLLSLDTTSVNYDDIFLATVNGQMDLNTLTGNFFFDVDSIEIPLSDTQVLKLADKNTRIQLHFDEKAGSFIFPMSHWKFGEYTIAMDKNKLTAPLKFDSKNIINDLRLHVPNMADIRIDGVLDLARASTKLDLIVSNINHESNDLNLSSSQAIPLELHYDNNKTDIYLRRPSLLTLNDKSLEVLPTKMQLKDAYLDINKTQLTFNKVLFTQLSTHYKLGEKKVDLLLKNTMLSSAELLFVGPSFTMSYRQDGLNHHLDSDDLGVHVLLNDEKALQLTLKDFKKLYPYSKTLQMYEVKAGSADLTFVNEHIGMDLQLLNFPPLLSKDGKKVTTYNIKGRYQDEVAQLSINKDIDFIYYKKGKFIAKDIDFNLFQIKDYLKDIHNKNGKNDLTLFIQTQNCNVRLGDSGRKILADTIKIDIKNDTINAQLFHGKGGVIFQSEQDNVAVYGDKLNDKFINELFKFSTFKGGKLSFAVTGTYDNFKGIVQVDDTIIKEYTVLNNTLAFFNTIPSLMTFSVPGYSKKGLKVDKMYSNFDVNGTTVTIKDTKISSKELSITARGSSDLDKETIDLLMQVKTDLGSSAKDIPVIGYIIFGDDTISTTVRVHGDMKDPKVENSVVKNVIVAPYNIIERTITLPFKALDIFDSDASEKKE